MTNEQIGLLLIGLGVIINFGKQFYELFFKPSESMASDMNNQEKNFINQLHNIQMENVEYQKQILEQLGKLNGILSVQDSKMVTLDIMARDNRKDLRDLHSKVSVVEAKLEGKADK